MRLLTCMACVLLGAAVLAQDDLARARTAAEAAKTVAEARAALALVDAADADCTNEAAVAARWQAGLAANRLGEHELELQAWQGVCRYYEKQGVGDKNDEPFGFCQDARSFAALALKNLRRFDESLALREKVFAAWTKVDAPVRAAQARMEFAMALLDTGQVVRAVEEAASAHAAMEQVAAVGAFDRARMKRDCAQVLDDAGLVWDPRVATLREEALALCEQLDAETKKQPYCQEFVNDVGWTLANTRLQNGDLVRAQKLAQDTLARAEQDFGADDLRTTWPRGLLATIQLDLGDCEKAVAMLQKNLDLRTAKLAADHPNLQMVRLNHGFALMQAGRPKEAIPGFEAAIAVLEKLDLRQPFDRSMLSMLYDNLGFCYIDEGRLKEAKHLLEKSIARHEDPVAIAQAKGSLAWFHHRTGSFATAEQLFDESLPEVIRTQRHRQPCLYLERQALNYAAMGKQPELKRCLDTLLQTAAGIVKECHTLPGRPSRELAKVADRAAQAVLALDSRLAESDRGRLDAGAFEVLESLRGIEVRVTNEVARFPELEGPRRRTQAARAELTRLAATGASGDVLKAVEDKERIAFEGFYKALEGKGVKPRRLTVDAVAASLPKDSVAIAFRRLRLVDVDPKRPGVDRTRDVMEAHVVTSDRKLHRVPLGDAAAIEAAADAWRKAIEGGETRGRPAGEKGGDPAQTLATLVLDKPKAHFGKATRLVVCLDDVLHEVPVEAMPGTKDLRFEFVVSLFDLVEPPKAPTTANSLFAIGGLDYDTLPAGDANAAPSRGTAAAPPVDAQRGGPKFVWEFLEGSEAEVDRVGKRFATWAKSKPTVLKGATATRDAFLREAQSARYLHFATHAQFLLPADRQPDDDVAQRQDQVIRGFAPMALSLLALSGANQTGKAGEFLGVVTGEDIAAQNLSGCECAALSACETYQGEPLPGHGLASLQAAFHAAGARYVLSTRWRVDDQWAQETMDHFYRELWVQKKPPREALALAQEEVRKKSAREDKNRLFGPTKHWAAFVLTGPIER